MAINLVKESDQVLEMQLLIDGNRGVYLPREFAKCFICPQMTKMDKFHLSRVDPYGKNSELYWDAWDRVLSNGTVTMVNKFTHEESVWTLYVGDGGGDLFAVPPGFDWETYAGC